ncbi:MAG: hypothetical protein ACKOBZ_00580 [Nitrospira sp.]
METTGHEAFTVATRIVFATRMTAMLTAPVFARTATPDIDTRRQ